MSRPQWTNWGRNVTASGIEFFRPRDAGEVADLLRAAAVAGRTVRPVGSGHSFSAIGRPVDVALDPRALTGVRALDAQGRVRVGAGMTLAALNDALAALGRALPNLGDIDRQTVSGAIATGTHGTGGTLHGLASAVCGVDLVTPDGTLHRLRPTDAWFEPARINLGALGVVTEVELQTVPAFRLRADEGPMPLAAILADVDAFVASADHAEFFWFPYSTWAATRRNHRVAAGEGRPLPRWRSFAEDRLLTNTAFELVNRVGRARPAWVPALNRFSAATLGRRSYADASHRVFCSERRVRFVESEYAIPRDALGPVLSELRTWFDRTRAPVTFPLEVRFLAADDVWLSGAYERDVAYVAVHQYWRSDAAPLFAAFESIVGEHGGRPHWGKWHSLDAQRLAEIHPRFGDFRAVRDACDPDRVLANPHLERVLGP